MAQYYFDILDSYGKVTGTIEVPIGATVGRGTPDEVPDILIPGECRAAGLYLASALESTAITFKTPGEARIVLAVIAQAEQEVFLRQNIRTAIT